MSIDPNVFGDNISEVDADIDLTDITQFPITIIPTQQLSPSEVIYIIIYYCCYYWQIKLHTPKTYCYIIA